MESKPLQVMVVSADREVWSGEADQVIARTSEGDIGILPNHMPLLAALVPSGVEVFATGGNREIIAVDGGFISVDSGRVKILSQFAELASEVSLDQAERDLADAVRRFEAGEDEDETRKEIRRASAQVKAGRKQAGHTGL
ncbi:F0F1 ATP synthase subunit epsilon [Mariniluteicoccus endophyticus]